MDTSSYGSVSAGNSVSSYGSALDPDELRAQQGGTAQDENDDGIDDSAQASLVTGIFGVLYAMSKERTVGTGFVVLKLVADFLQLFLLVVTPQYGFDIQYYSKGWEIVNFMGLNQFFAARGLTFFLFVLYIMVILLVVVCCVSAWVAWCFKCNRFDQVWPIVFIQWFSTIFFQVLDVASLSLFLITLDCNYFSVYPEDEQYTNNEFPDIQCWTMPYLIHVVVSSASLLVFMVLATLVQLGEMELNPISRNSLAMGHSEVEVIGFLLRMAITMVNTFVTDKKWMAALQLILSWWLFWIYWKWNPHQMAVVNYVRVASYSCIFYCAVLLCFITFKPNVDKEDTEAVYDYKRKLTIALWVGMALAALAGAGASYLRLRYYNTYVLNRFKAAPPGTRPKYIYKFQDPREVEIVARCCRDWSELDVLNEKAVTLAEQVIKAGMALLPKDAYMVILYSSFLIDVQGSYQSGYSALQAAKKMNPSFLERFAIFSREHQHTQKASKGGQGADLVSYAEFQRNYRMALRAHREALLATRAFWQCLMHHRVSFKALADAVSMIDAKVRNAERVYRNVMQRHRKAWRLLREYSRFLETVKNDPWSAAKWNAEAEELQQAEEDAMSNVHSDLGHDNGGSSGTIKDLGSDDGGGRYMEGETDAEGNDNATQRTEAIKARLEDSRAVIVINATATITTANKPAFEIFGYSKAEMLGKNVKFLVPAPFAEHHDSYVRNYVTTGKPVILGMNTEFVALHKERYVFSTMMQITKISGIGEDTLFMGVIEPLPPFPSTAKAWVMDSGAFVSVDAPFTDWFGFKPEDLLGAFISSLVVEAKELQEFLQEVKANDRRAHSGSKEEQAAAAGHQEFAIEGLHIRHKFAAPMEVSMTIENGGVGNHHFYVLYIRRKAHVSKHMLVTDPRGRVCHCTEDLAKMLGHTPHSIMANSAQHALCNVMPQPFGQLHKWFLQDMQPPLVPSYSCRSKLSVCLNTVGEEGAVEMRPFRLGIRRREERGSLFHIISLEEVNFEKALDERRLTLLVDPVTGVVRHAGPSPPTLFGMQPRDLVGKYVSEIIDALETLGGAQVGAPADPQARALAAATDREQLQWALMQLAKRATNQPGMSWRVGVAPPVNLEEVKALGPLAAQLAQRRLRPAVMTVNVHLGGAALTSSMLAAMHSSGVDGSTPSTSQGTGVPGVPPVSAAKTPILLELGLWRADLITGVVELDSHGRIVHATEHKLYPPGLLFGMASALMEKRRLSTLLPMMEDHPVTDLFEPGLGTSKGSKAKSGLKMSTEPVDGKFKKPGRVNIVRVQHRTDGGDLEISMQAVHKWGMTDHMYVIMHLYSPRCAPENWMELVAQEGQPRHLPRPPSVPSLHEAHRAHLRHSGSMPNGSMTLRPRPPVKSTQPKKGDAGGCKGVRWGIIHSSSLPGMIAASSEADKTNTEFHADEMEWGNGHGDSDEDGADPAAAGSEAGSEKPDGGEAGWDGATEMEDPTLQQQQQADSDDKVSTASRSEHSRMEGSAHHSGDDQTDYRRGQRYKKLKKLLAATSAQRIFRRFKTHSFTLVGVVLALHMPVFITLYILINKEKQAVDDLNAIGQGAQNIMAIAIGVRDVDILLKKMTFPGLRDLSSPDDLQTQLDNLHTNIELFQERHAGAYLGFNKRRRLPETYGVTQFTDAYPAPVATYGMYPLWDLGNIYAAKALNVWSNFQNYTATGNSISNWSNAQFIWENGVNALCPGYFTTLDAVLEEVIRDADSVSNVQLIVLAAEGCVLCGLAALYMWIIASQVAVQRFNLYNVFMLLPVGLVRSLASKSLDIVEGSGEEQGAEQQEAEKEEGGAGGAPTPSHQHADYSNTVKFNISASFFGYTQEHTLLGRMAEALMFWRPRPPRVTCSRVKGGGRQRVLKHSYKAMAWLALPFIAWGALIILFNAIGDVRMNAIVGPIATFNTVNFVNVRVHQVVFLAQEMAYSNSIAGVAFFRATLMRQLQPLKTEYKCMLYGSKAVPNETSPHFTHAKQGLLFSGEGSRNMLFKMRGCIAVDASECLPVGNQYYELTTHGVGMGMQHFFQMIETVLNDQGLDPTLGSEEFQYTRNSSPILEGGMNKIAVDYQREVNNVYE